MIIEVVITFSYVAIQIYLYKMNPSTATLDKYLGHIVCKLPEQRPVYIAAYRFYKTGKPSTLDNGSAVTNCIKVGSAKSLLYIQQFLQHYN